MTILYWGGVSSKGERDAIHDFGSGLMDLG